MVAVLLLGTAMAAAGVFMDWTQSSDGWVDWEAPMTRFVASWLWVALGLLAAGIAFVMIVAARRAYIPQMMALGAAVCATVGGALAMIALSGAREAAARGVVRGWTWTHSQTEASIVLTPAPWLLVAGFAIAAAGALALWRRGVAESARSAADLARADRELASRDGAPPVAPEHDPVPRL